MSKALYVRNCTVDQIEMVDEDGVVHIVSSGLNARGQELPDPVPMEPPVGIVNGPTLKDLIERMVHGKLSAMAEAEGFETEAEADDFDVEDDPIDPRSPWEEDHL